MVFLLWDWDGFFVLFSLVTCSSSFVLPSIVF